MATSNNTVIDWFEIPAKDLSRASKFYEAILGVKMSPLEMPGIKMAMFPTEEGSNTGGAVVEGENYEPHTSGTIVYLNGGKDLSKILKKVEKAGGKVLLEKTSIGEFGFIGRFLDTEGNQVALHNH